MVSARLFLGSDLDYAEPYCNHLPKNPTMEEVCRVVVEQAVRPELDCFNKDSKVSMVKVFHLQYIQVSEPLALEAFRTSCVIVL